MLRIQDNDFDSDTALVQYSFNESKHDFMIIKDESKHRKGVEMTC